MKCMFNHFCEDDSALDIFDDEQASGRALIYVNNPKPLIHGSASSLGQDMKGHFQMMMQTVHILCLDYSLSCIWNPLCLLLRSTVKGRCCLAHGGRLARVRCAKSERTSDL